MPMGIVSDSDFEIEKNRLNSTNDNGVKTNKQDNATSARIDDINRGRGNKKETPKEIREAVAKCAIDGQGSASEIAEAFGVSESSVSAYKEGAHSTASYNEPNADLLSKITDHKAKISKRAQRTLMSALREITPDRLATVKPRELAGIAKDMAAIISDMEPPTQINPSQQNNVQFVFMAPRVREETAYPVIQVSE